MANGHKWQFASRFRRQAFGWRSGPPIQRIKEALSEIRQVARKEPVLAAEGAVAFLEKLSPALERVDSSSGALGSAVNKAIASLVSVIAGAEVSAERRQRWLERLWEALQDDNIPYIESLGDYWGELCATPALASAWADTFLPMVERVWGSKAPGHGYSKGTSACLASLLYAGRYEQLLSLLERAPFQWWHNRRWGVMALAAQGKKAEAIRYAEESRGLNDPGWQIAQACEGILLSSGLADEAYRRYAIEANPGSTNIAIFRAIVKKYPGQPPEKILRDLVASTPGAEGKWFSAAKDAGLFDMAIDLASTSPTDPRTLTRAARDFAEKQPKFAVAAGFAALRWMALGYGYELTGMDVLGAYDALMQAATHAGGEERDMTERLVHLIVGASPRSDFVRAVLASRLGIR